MPTRTDDHHDRSAPVDEDLEPDEEQRRDEQMGSSLPFGGRLPSWVFLIAAALSLALLVALLVTPLTRT
ncbi:hypothetical protein [Parafrankia sp. BMG5.11]|uniref:hypothetical protein n=1 Tax=Parafrankia sp. BMG5.11 TaxID=222540 RepID=UPI0010393040|nr:hypothetical protein [Parafrankia sp. BMG5.11]TCJ34630.1 hypothetical protein E0504_32045 [Parafrankia sp. BMG5.11]